MNLKVDGWKNTGAIPAQFAFGKPGVEVPFAPSENLSPSLSWSELPEGTQSLALILHDPDVPSKPDDVNKSDRMVPADLPRCDFYHWVLIDIPATLNGLPHGAGSESLVARGKPVGPTKFGVTGRNDYTGWFAGDPEMGGVYGGYDGPCPPWNDSIIHNYIFTLYALDVQTLELSESFTGAEALAAMEGHVLDAASYSGRYSMNPDVPVIE
ncbi:MAG: YbhB/YbcL family Raf kinase inhibitor-like protein [Verrucomicrobiota bacterium]